MFCSMAIIRISVLSLTVPKLMPRSLKKAVVDLIFSVVAGLLFSVLLGNELSCG